MTQRINVERKLNFRGSAESNPNVFGNIWNDKVIYFDDFLGDVLRDEWTPSGNNGGTEAITAGTGGTVTLTTTSTSEDRSILAGGLNWYPAQNPAFFARVQVDNIATVGINIGLTDAVTEANDHLAFEISTATIVDTCTDGVSWVFDTDATAKYWHYCNTKDSTQGGTSYGVAPVNATYAVLGVSIDSDGNATFWYNGQQVGYKASAVTSTTPLCPFMGVIARTSAARILTVDYVALFQDRS